MAVGQVLSNLEIRRKEGEVREEARGRLRQGEAEERLKSVYVERGGGEEDAERLVQVRGRSGGDDNVYTPWLLLFVVGIAARQEAAKISAALF